MTKPLVLFFCSVLMVPSTIQSLELIAPVQKFTHIAKAFPTNTVKFLAAPDSLQIGSLHQPFGANEGSLPTNKRLISWKGIFNTPVLKFSPARWINRMRMRFAWMLLCWCSIAIPRATATVPATTSAPIHFTVEPREAFAHPQKQESPSPEGTPLDEHERRIRSRTGSAIIVSTALLAAARVNRSKRSHISTDMDDAVDDDTRNQELLSKRHDLQWLFPRSPPASNHESPADVETKIADSSMPQFLSSTNKIIADAKAIATEKLKTNLMIYRSSRKLESVPVSSSSPQKIAVPQNSKKSTYRQQQPKSPVEEARLQAKYAAIESLEERAFTVLVDLGMVELSSSEPTENAWQ